MTDPTAKIQFADVASHDEMDPIIAALLSPYYITWERGPAGRCDHYGTEYEELTLLGTHVNGVYAFALDEQTARSRYLDRLLQWLDGRKHIVWRIYPEMEQCKQRMALVRLWYMYSRLTAYNIKPEPKRD